MHLNEAIGCHVAALLNHTLQSLVSIIPNDRGSCAYNEATGCHVDPKIPSYMN